MSSPALFGQIAVQSLYATPEQVREALAKDRQFTNRFTWRFRRVGDEWRLEKS